MGLQQHVKRDCMFRCTGGVVVTWIVAIGRIFDPPRVQFPASAVYFFNFCERDVRRMSYVVVVPSHSLACCATLLSLAVSPNLAT